MQEVWGFKGAVSIIVLWMRLTLWVRSVCAWGVPRRTKLSLPQLGPPAIWPPKFELIRPLVAVSDIARASLRCLKKPIHIWALTLLYNLEFFSFLIFFGGVGWEGVSYGASLTLNSLCSTGWSWTHDQLLSQPPKYGITSLCYLAWPVWVLRCGFLAHTYTATEQSELQHINETHRDTNFFFSGC